MDNQAEILIKKMMDKLNATSNKELAELIGLSAAAISRWKKYNYIDPIKKKCKELGIYNEIFEDAQTYTQYVRSNSGNNTQSGDIHSTSMPQKQINDDDDEIDPAVFEVFKRAYKKANVNEEKLDDFITYLLQFK